MHFLNIKALFTFKMQVSRGCTPMAKLKFETGSLKTDVTLKLLSLLCKKKRLNDIIPCSREYYHL